MMNRQALPKTKRWVIKVGSSLVTAIMRGLIEDLNHLAAQPGQFLTALNHGVTQILERSSTLLFVTAFYAVADVAKGTLCCASAGHPSALLWRDGGHVRELTPKSCGPALGVFADTVYDEQCWPLTSGDRVLLFTDGLSEKCNAQGEEFGTERLSETLRAVTNAPPESVGPALLTSATNFANSKDFDDDVCLLLTAVRG